MDHRLNLLALAAAASMGLAGCQHSAPTRDDGAPSAALEDLDQGPQGSPEKDKGRSLAELARQSAIDLQTIQRQLDERQSGSPPLAVDGQRRPWQDRMADKGGQDAPAGQWDQPPAPAREADEPTSDKPAPPPDPFALVLGRLEVDSGDPQRALAAAMLARAIREYADAHDGGQPGQYLSPPERATVEAISPLLHALMAGDRGDAPRRIAEALDDVVREIPEVLPVRINDAALATDIYGFAAYKPFERYTFLAGRPNRVLLYTEPANFRSQLATEPASRQEASNPGSYEVVLGLELRLYNERGSMLAWRKPEERVVMRSGRPRSEIYLGTVIDLPASLSVGRYQLKVIVRDHLDGSEDERVIPIEIVADPRLASPSTRTP